jgi:FKBP-type peptidyl-prolyl cis-trans isomerase
MRLRSFAATAVLVAGLIPNLGCGASTITEQGTMEPIKPDADAKEIENGLKYKDTIEGSGDPAKPGQKVTVHYTGWLATNGKKFDSSLDRGTPFSVELGAGQVIKGWDKGLVGMKIGGKRRLYIPSEMAYGSRARGAVIPANSDLVFDVEMKDITGKPLAEIKIPADAVKLPSGLKYVDNKIGTGEEAKSGNRVSVHYTGMLQKNGKKFDSSVDRNEPFKFGLGRKEVIEGWDIGVAGMKEGGKRTLYIPSELGYGKRGAGGDIPPDADLVFEVELLKAK